MATTYTANARLQKPATSDRNWDVPINANVDALDAMSAIGGLATSTTETPSASLKVTISPGNFANSSRVVVSFAGLIGLTVPPSSTTYLWLTDAGVVTSGSSFPTTAHLRLAHAVSGATSILNVVDERIQCSVNGSGMGFVLKSGDTMLGPLTIANPSTNAPMVVADPVNRLVGFFGVSPASQATALTPLASNSSGTASDSLADVGSTFSQSILNNNFASVAAKVDAVIAALKRHGLMGS